MEPLPLEKTCQIISKITQLEDVLSLRLVSSEFQTLVRNCIRAITTNQLVRIPVNSFLYYIQLVYVDHRLLLISDGPNIAAISTLPRLEWAHFILEQTQHLTELLRNLNLPPKFPRVNFKITLIDDNDLVAIIIQMNRIFFLPRLSHFYRTRLTNMIQQIEPRLVPVNLPEGVVIFKLNLKKFLWEINLGPSRILAEYGMSFLETIRLILNMYVRIKNLRRDNMIYADDTIKRFFGPVFNLYQQAGYYPNFNLSAFPESRLSLLAEVSSSGFTLLDIAEFNIPAVIPTEEQLRSLNRELEILI